MRNILSADKLHMLIAEAASRASRDPKTQVGCAIYDIDMLLASVGWNRMPTSTLELTPESWHPDAKNDLVLHAEKIAIGIAARTGRNTNGGTLYTTKFPCFNCSTSIVSAGIVRVVASRLGSKGWSEDRIRSKNLLEHSNVVYELWRDV